MTVYVPSLVPSQLFNISSVKMGIWPGDEARDISFISSTYYNLICREERCELHLELGHVLLYYSMFERAKVSQQLFISHVYKGFHSSLV